MSPANLLTCELQQEEFTKICGVIHRLCGITLRPGKEGLVKARLLRRLSALDLDSFDAYLAYVERDTSGKELISMVDVLTTNKTNFFREPQHFTYVRETMIPQLLQADHPMRFWSAGCSSGEEPYTLAMVLREVIPDIDRRNVRILATDISTKVLATARRAIYDQDVVHDIPQFLLQKYFTKVCEAPVPAFQAKETLRKMVRVARLNLMHDWPMRGPFDAIFCRNVMIYFDKPTQEWLVQRYWQLLRPGGHLFIGHSESLTTASHAFHYVQPALYQK